MYFFYLLEFFSFCLSFSFLLRSSALCSDCSCYTFLLAQHVVMVTNVYACMLADDPPTLMSLYLLCVQKLPIILDIILNSSTYYSR